MSLRHHTKVLLLILMVSLAAIGATPMAATAAPTATDAASVQTAEECEFPITLTDATGEEVTLEEPPERVTTTNPSVAQIMWEIGGAEQVVGTSQFAHYLDGAEDRTNVSSTEFGVNIELVVSTEPDLVLAPSATSVETVEALRDAGLTVYHFPEETDFDEVREATTIVGQLTGNCEGAAEANAWMDANVEAAATATTDADRPGIMYPLGGDFVVGGDTFIHEMIVASGGDNLAADEFDGYQVMNDEVVLSLDPEYLIATEESTFVLEEEPYASTRAVENDAIVMMEVNYLNQPAPRSVVFSVQNLTAELHPDLYDESDFVSRAEAAALVDSDSATDDADTDDAGDDATPTETAADDAAGDADTDTTIPGFGPVAAIAALILSVLYFRRD
ncbi:PGF-CTERM-anchored ABC transporter substrate-binding protein [Natronocalculus amylovorans]|uniref:PGF-CTERM-anchored ABC transporter substrate-binding protein n=1 Tax=Natronocalculus amylovorans TaxID=2917812 RepID=A0AAE3FYT5_9EURY|nr:PGF-CTERM-anchored ABC transporter substrate-binding protein [Natronocalculus amylovorans]MCL9817548.1 PGF-CTERM-anchored ABC transporter substrate-binding protein [Natronocalculus amylovorans]